jgi:hypothetical protein
MPDLATNSSVFNAGRFHRRGITAAVSQQLGENTTATLAYGYAGAMTVGGGELAGSGAEEVRQLLHSEMRHSLTARVSGVAPKVGTRYVGSYQVTDYAALQLVHLSLTQRSTLEPGLNVYLRQPIPGLSGVMSGRLEATVEMRNILGQGYVALPAPEQKNLVLMPSPRTFRGGLSLIF